jgi:hypothetical protein
MTTCQERCRATVSPPSSPCAITPAASSLAGPIRSGRRGRTRYASTPAAIQAPPTTAENRRLPYSIQTCVSSSGTKVPEQSGQLGQPSPEPVRRTPAPLNTISTSVASAAYATHR